MNFDRKEFENMLAAHELYLSALDSDDIDHKEQLLETALELDPDNLDVQVSLLFDVKSYDMSTIDLIKEAQQLIQANKPLPEEEEDVY